MLMLFKFIILPVIFKKTFPLYLLNWIYAKLCLIINSFINTMLYVSKVILSTLHYWLDSYFFKYIKMLETYLGNFVYVDMKFIFYTLKADFFKGEFSDSWFGFMIALDSGLPHFYIAYVIWFFLIIGVPLLFYLFLRQYIRTFFILLERDFPEIYRIFYK